uniref:ATP synthase F0 subunit 8 n=1 Tax=Halocynthia hilgendorfi ssp. n. KRK-2020 TaxID=2769794 RepID=A0A7G9XFL6_9ASCI|nr:ATP synthase F0 subunit 8 [Halocynthia hilgendorfi ssp. n. KRK-2020]
MPQINGMGFFFIFWLFFVMLFIQYVLAADVMGEKEKQ